MAPPRLLVSPVGIYPMQNQRICIDQIDFFKPGMTSSVVIEKRARLCDDLAEGGCGHGELIPLRGNRGVWIKLIRVSPPFLFAHTLVRTRDFGALTDIVFEEVYS